MTTRAMHAATIVLAVVASLAAAAPGSHLRTHKEYTSVFGVAVKHPQADPPEADYKVFHCGECPEDHHCLKIPNGFETCVWEGFHTREYCIADRKRLWKRADNTTLEERPAPEIAAASMAAKAAKASDKGAWARPGQAAIANNYEERHIYDIDQPLITCAGKYDACAELWPADGRHWGYCIDKAHWMLWDPCRRPDYGHHKKWYHKAMDWIDSATDKVIYGAAYDPCEPINYPAGDMGN